jgi:alkanesulfonate monooxygenase SsuD/methylene tetrahydromethanopterin reductase-like flavin-dependent oxidoreductase (luciferase family)
MKIGIGLPNVTPGTDGPTIVGWAKRAEHLGFDALAVIDRMAYDSYEPLVALAMAAAVTQHVELVTNVIIAPARNTTLLAKQAASLDRASGGRLTLGLAVGVREDDFAVCGLSPRDRGRMLDAQLHELRRLWAVAGGPGQVGPAPARTGGPRLLIGGAAEHAGRRAAEHGDGWTMMIGSPDEFAAGYAQARAAWASAGRAGDPAGMAVFYAALGDDAHGLAAKAITSYYGWLGDEIVGHITASVACDAAAVAERIEAFGAAGAGEVVVVPCSSDPGQLELLAAAALRRPALV